MTHKTNTLRTWMLALGFTMALCVVVFGFGLVHTLIDDVVVMRALSGFSGEYPRFLPFMHGMIVLPLAWLHQQIPSIHWYSWFLTGCFYGSFAIILKCLLQRCSKARKGQAILALLAFFVLLLLGFALEISFTNVSTLLGCAALAQLLSFDARNASARQMFLATLLAFGLAALAYGLRMENIYPILGFCGLGALLQMFRLHQAGCLRQKQGRHFLTFLLIPIVGLALLMGWRVWECSLPENREIDAWNQARIPVTDFLGMKQLPDSLLEELGWTRVEAEAFENWFFLDSSVDTQAFEKIEEYQRSELQKQGLWKRIAASQQTFWRFFGEHPAVLIAVGLMGCCAAGIFLGECKEKKWLALVSLVASYLLLSVLAFRGRFLMRAVLAVMAPEMTYLLMLNADEPCARFRHLLCKCLSYVLLAGMIVAGFLVRADQLNFEWSFSPLRSYRYRNSWSLIDEYAAQNPEALFVVDTMADDRLFPDMLEGRATNVLYFGGWQVRDSEFESQLRRFGIDPKNMDGTLFLQDNVCLVSLSTEYAGWIQAYVQSLCDHPVTAKTLATFKENYWAKVIQFHLE